MTVSTAQFAKALEPLTGKWFESGKTRLPELYREVFNVQDMGKRSYIEDALIVGTGLLQAKSEGEAVSYDSIRQGFVKRYTATEYSSGLIITQNMLDDGINLDIIRRRAEMLGRSATEVKNIVAFNVLNNAFSTSHPAGDGAALCSVSHPTIAGNLSNTLATATDLSEAALEQIDLSLASILDDRGLRQNIKAQKLVIPRALKFEAHRIIKSGLRAGTADNDANAMNDMNLFPDGTLVVDYLTDADSYFVLTNEDSQGLTYYSRQEPVMSADSDFDTRNAKFKVYMRLAVGCTNWRHVFGVQGA